jgi:hypothetical protein
MKKPAAKSKGSARSKPGPAKVSSAAKSGGRQATKVARTAAVGRTGGAVAYTPPPLKSDGWPPFRYPLQ